VAVVERLRAVRGIDKYILWSVLILSIAIPIIRPIGLPISVDPMTKEFYDVIEALPKGGKVWLENGVSPGMMAEMLPGITAVMTHLMRRSLRIVVVVTTDPSPIPIMDKYVLPELERRKVLGKYGEGWVKLPFVPGGETGLAALAASIRSTTSVDYYGTPLDTLPVMQGLNTIKDFDLVILFGHSGPFYSYIRQIQAPYKMSFIAQQLTMDIPAMMPYYPTQVRALLKGLGGAAEYEKLIGFPGRGLASTEGQSLSHIWIVLAVIAANINYLVGKRRGKK
jgi:hypothetical protein